MGWLSQQQQNHQSNQGFLIGFERMRRWPAIANSRQSFEHETVLLQYLPEIHSAFKSLTKRGRKCSLKFGSLKLNKKPFTFKQMQP